MPRTRYRRGVRALTVDRVENRGRSADRGACARPADGVCRPRIPSFRSPRARHAPPDRFPRTTHMHARRLHRRARAERLRAGRRRKPAPRGGLAATARQRPPASSPTCCPQNSRTATGRRTAPVPTGPQVIMLFRPARQFFLRANIWPSRDEHMFRASGAARSPTSCHTITTSISSPWAISAPATGRTTGSTISKRWPVAIGEPAGLRFIERSRLEAEQAAALPRAPRRALAAAARSALGLAQRHARRRCAGLARPVPLRRPPERGRRRARPRRERGVPADRRGAGRRRGA